MPEEAFKFLEATRAASQVLTGADPAVFGPSRVEQAIPKLIEAPHDKGGHPSGIRKWKINPKGDAGYPR